MLSTPNTSNSPELERSAGLEVDSHSLLHAVIMFLLPTLGTYLEFQKKSPLEERKNIMVAIYANHLLYGMGLMAEFKLKTCVGSRCLSIIKRFTPLFGILVLVVIMIILYPVPGYAAVVIWALVTMEAVIKLLREILQWLHPIFIRGREIVTNYSKRPENPSPGGQECGSANMKANNLLRKNELLGKLKLNYGQR